MLSAHQNILPIDQIMNAMRFLNTTKTLPDMLNKAAKIDNTKTIGIISHHLQSLTL